MLSDTENLTIIIPLVIVSDRQRKSIVRCSETTVLCCLVKLFIINTAPDNLPDSLLCLCDHRHGWIKYRANIKYSFNEREQQQGWQCHKLINFHLWYEDVRKFVRNSLFRLCDFTRCDSLAGETTHQSRSECEQVHQITHCSTACIHAAASLMNEMWNLYKIMLKLAKSSPPHTPLSSSRCVWYSSWFYDTFNVSIGQHIHINRKLHTALPSWMLN